MAEKDHKHTVTTVRDGKWWLGLVDGVPVKRGGRPMRFRHKEDAEDAADLSAWCMDQ